jgi:hypothetical protein
VGDPVVAVAAEGASRWGPLRHHPARQPPDRFGETHQIDQYLFEQVEIPGAAQDDAETGQAADQVEFGVLGPLALVDAAVGGLETLAREDRGPGGCDGFRSGEAWLFGCGVDECEGGSAVVEAGAVGDADAIGDGLLKGCVRRLPRGGFQMQEGDARCSLGEGLSGGHGVLRRRSVWAAARAKRRQCRSDAVVARAFTA